MDFIRELNDSTLYTFHSHTEFCDGRAQMEAFARRAAARDSFIFMPRDSSFTVFFHGSWNLSR